MINTIDPLKTAKNTLVKSPAMRSLRLKSPTIRNVFLFNTLILGVLTAPALYAASSDEAPWYQVNVIIFERIYSSENEYWSKDNVLAYPKNMAFLGDPGSHNTPQVTKTDASQYLQTPSHEEQDITFTPEPPFIKLNDEKGLQDTAKRLRNARNYRVLFHESWRQPLQSLNKSPAILIKGGDKFDDKYALNGAITLGVGRYLHAKANLWLTQFEANFGQEIGEWPALPKPPSQNVFTEQVRNETTDSLLTSSNLDKQTNLTHHSQPQKQTRFDDTDVELNLDNGFKSESFKNTDITFTHNTLSHTLTDTLPIDNIINERYIIKNITTLNQTRRMRSNEIHYIDHPKLGVIINMTRYERPKAPDTKPKEASAMTADDQNTKVTIPTPSLDF